MEKIQNQKLTELQNETIKLQQGIIERQNKLIKILFKLNRKILRDWGISIICWFLISLIYILIFLVRTI